LQQESAIVATPNELVESAKKIVWKPLTTTLAGKYDSFLITLPEFVSQMKIIRVDQDGVCIAVTSAPALLYYRGVFLTKKELLPTALHVRTSYVAEDQRTIVDLPADFIRWGRRILNWVKRSAPDTYHFKTYRITAKAEAARKAGVQMIW
jgi:hypothetical protein